LTNKSNLIGRLYYDITQFFDNMVVAYFFGPPCIKAYAVCDGHAATSSYGVQLVIEGREEASDVIKQAFLGSIEVYAITS